MATDSIEQEILIKASPQVVWAVITEPAQISRWLSDAADFEPQPGADGTLTWRPGERGGAKELEATVPLLVIDAEPFCRFAFRWNHPPGTAADEHNSAFVEFTLTEESGGTRLRVVESGIAAVAHGEEAKARYRLEHERGWRRHFGELLDHVASQPQRESR